MIYNNGEIIISPKVIYWIEPPDIIDEYEKIDLLKNDIMLVSYDGDMNVLYDLKKSESKYTAYFFNLEKIFNKNHVEPKDQHVFAANLAMFIQNLIPERSLVHIGEIDENLMLIFKRAGIGYLEKTFNDKKQIISNVLTMIMPFFTEQQRNQRSSLRLNLVQMKYKVEITNLNNKKAPIIYGILKDISLAGMCFVLAIGNDLPFFKLKDKIQVRVFIEQSILKINTGFITRIDEANIELGIIININDPHMIREDYANRITSLIYNWIKGILDKNWKIDT